MFSPLVSSPTLRPAHCLGALRVCGPQFGKHGRRCLKRPGRLLLSIGGS